MASHDPMDLNARSQAFYRDFYLFHKQSCDAWYIKDAEHAYIDASATFLSRFLPSSVTSVIGLHDKDIAIGSNRDVFLMSEFESEAIDSGRTLTIFTWQYFIDNHDVKSFVVKINPYSCNNKHGVIINVMDLAEVDSCVGWESAVIPFETDNVIDSCKLITSHPLTYLTEREWEVAWLVMIGKSQRWIASFLNVKRQAIDRKLNGIYLKLRVFDKRGLVLFGKNNQWINYIPANIIAETTLIKL